MIDPLTRQPITRKEIRWDIRKTKRCLANPHNQALRPALVRRLVRLARALRQA